MYVQMEDAVANPDDTMMINEAMDYMHEYEYLNQTEEDEEKKDKEDPDGGKDKSEKKWFFFEAVKSYAKKLYNLLFG